ncbi:MAG: chemotaxis response regulator protein-glutamate methylesterase [Planctomycetales bacterium]|nr:chemotaxis response regulator protein-glutamate methylesterase [Planctomycetales bacterium]
MQERNIRVMVVDDSAVIREMIGDFVDAAPGMEVVGKASDGKKAIDLFRQCQPDVVTLDIQMPNMDGLATLRALLEIRPVPTVMVSALTQRGASETFEALELGALDYVAKPERGSQLDAILGDELPRKIRSIHGANVAQIIAARKKHAARVQAAPKARPVAHVEPRTNSAPAHFAESCIAIGISTGGPPALTTLFSQLEPPLPPIVVVQHMPKGFTKAFSWRLNSQTAIEVKEAEEGDVLQPNHAYLAPGGAHLRLVKFGSSVKCRIEDSEPVSSHKPSVDVMMTDAAAIFGPLCLGVIMTGMGRDGADGCGAIRAAGGYAMGQDQASSDVYGMNKVAFVEGKLDRQFSLGDGAALIRQQIAKLGRRHAVGV